MSECTTTLKQKNNIRADHERAAAKTQYNSLAGATDDSEGIEDILQLLPQALRDAVQAYLSASRADAEDAWSPEIFRSALRVHVRMLLITSS